MEIFSKLLFYNFMGCRKSQVLRGLDYRFPTYLLFNNAYEAPTTVYKQIVIEGKNAWGYYWEIEVNNELLGIEEESKCYNDFKSAKSDIIEMLDNKQEVYVWTKNKYIPHMQLNESDPEGVHSLTLTSCIEDTFKIMDYPFERDYESEILEQAFDSAPKDKRVITSYKLNSLVVHEDIIRTIDSQFQEKMNKCNDDFSMYDFIFDDMEEKGVIKLINQSMHIFGVISLSRLLTSVFMQSNNYSEGAIYGAQQISKMAESIKNNFMKLAINPSKLNVETLQEKFQKIKHLEIDFLKQIQHEIQTGEKREVSLNTLKRPENITALHITDSSIWITWDESEYEEGLIEYDIIVDDLLVDSCTSNNYIIGNLSADMNYKITIKSRNKFGSSSEETSIEIATIKLQNYGKLSTFKPVFTSSSENDDFCGKRVVDDNPLTRWSSEYNDQQWIYVDLGSVKEINEIRIHWEYAYAAEYQIMISIDSENWTLVQHVQNGQGGIYIISDLKETTRYVKVNCLKRDGIYGYSIWELSVINYESLSLKI
ncbi:discoidin domain-containing protein [Paenibacillus glacialis]|uniref:F5/8 type C domain-containing protein n=1 Tax=Paenibacillus glacialis TaxID=494026 RepID=A0A168MJF0_9BACL|nr:discoidin domain-containing protein [Paenibacillus glacialis]OAB44752.1 hypothetical protein PGLA_04885 [Paenibacillus glacialis]